MEKVSIFLADGFEEIEGLTVVDLLRRAGINAETVSVAGKLDVAGAHGISVKADVLFEEADFSDTDMLVLPGGMPGTVHLKEHKGLEKLLIDFYNQEKYIGAICAAPGILGGLGLLKGRRACSYPSVEDKLEGAYVVQDPVTVDGRVITSRGRGTAMAFGLALIAEARGAEKAEEIRKSVLYAG